MIESLKLIAETRGFHTPVNIIQMHYNKYIPFPNGSNVAPPNEWNPFTNINSMTNQQEKFMYAPTQAPQMMRSPFFDPLNYSFFPSNTCSPYFDASHLAFDNSYWAPSKPNESCCFTRNSSPVNGSVKQVPMTQQAPLAVKVSPYSTPLERYVKTTTTTTNSFTRIEETTCKPTLTSPPLNDSLSSGNHSSTDSSFLTSPRAIRKINNNCRSSISEYSDGMNEFLRCF